MHTKYKNVLTTMTHDLCALMFSKAPEFLPQFHRLLSMFRP